MWRGFPRWDDVHALSTSLQELGEREVWRHPLARRLRRTIKVKEDAVVEGRHRAIVGARRDTIEVEDRTRARFLRGAHCFSDRSMFRSRRRRWRRGEKLLRIVEHSIIPPRAK